MTKSNLYIGTSGWSYPHWKENFYHKTPQKKWLNFFSEEFSTVEINNTFYRLPKKEVVHHWCEEVSEDFKFSVKASRYITHIKRLKDCEDNLAYFLEIVKEFKSKLGPILFQMPPSFKQDYERLENFTNLLEPGLPYVFEFRNDSWFNEDTYAFLKKRKIALCITDLSGKTSPENLTVPFVYIRLHGPYRAYQGSYSETALLEWKEKIEHWSKKVPVFCYFDNDEKAYAINDCISLKKMLGLAS